VLVANVSLPVSKYPSDESGLVFFTTLLERVRAIPGVEATAVVDPLPFGDGGWQTGLVGEGMPPALGDQGPLLDAAVVSPDYFAAMGIPLLAGRVFTPEDRRGAPGVVILSRQLARRFWPGKDPVGKRVKIGARSSATPWPTV